MTCWGKIIRYKSLSKKKTLPYDLPFSDIAGGRIEGSAHFNQLAAVGCIRDQVTFVVDLAKGFVYGAIQLEFENVGTVSRFHHSIGTPEGTAYFGFDKLSQ